MILVTGGAGYIGSFMTRRLLDDGREVLIIDNLERGHASAVDPRAKFVKADIRDANLLDSLFKENHIDSILHFAGLISVEESTKDPVLYQEVNVDGSKILFDIAIRHGVKKIIFSSTAAVYGNPIEVPIPENHSKNPTSPYGATKLKVEEILEEKRKEDSSIRFVCLRYFNACGASIDGSMGEAHSPETHIIPLAIKAAIGGNPFKLYGRDYKTPDGTCVRDYIHVLDLVEAHLLALSKLDQVEGGYFYNVGTGSGFSNLEVIKTIESVSGKEIQILDAERRPGDADQLIAGVSAIKNDLGFEAKFSDLRTIVESAWKWHSRSS